MQKGERRRLQKFGLYSTSIVLPKQFLEELGWQAGDAVRVQVNHTEQAIILDRQPRKTAIQPAPANKRADISTGQSEHAPSSGQSVGVDNTKEELLPIPELP